MSITTQRTITKISYEFHCYNNNINQKEDRYDSIINFILSGDLTNDSPVEIIDDVIFNEITKESFNYIEGAHSLFEYADGGKRYVVCSLFGSVWYRTTVCIDFASSYEEKTMNLFLLDGSSAKHKSTLIGVPCSIDGTIGKVESELFFNPYAIKITDIKDKRVFLEPRIKTMDLLINGAIITIVQIERYRDLLLSIKYDSLDTDELQKIIMYKENIKITALLCFYCFKNLPIKKYTQKELLSYFSIQHSQIINQDLTKVLFLSNFISDVKTGINAFNQLIDGQLIID